MLYAYAVTRGVPALDGLRGVAGADVHAVTHRGLAAVVSPVPPDEFGERALQGNLGRLGWLEQVARAHHAVVAAVSARSTTVPLRLATVYRGADRMAQVLADGHARFSGALDRVEGRVELGVKVFPVVAGSDAGRPGAAPASPGTAPASPGAAYLRRRRDALRSHEDTWAAAAKEAQVLDAALTGIAVDRYLHRAQPAALTGDSTGTVPGTILNAAYLVDIDDVAPFAARLRSIAGASTSARAELTGPWAPYSFALTDDAVAGP